ncbi:MAG: amidophosphoribosyltransferase [Planctomycetes bacterium]|nr:amidophosphoribosyltransferase [Planctomycetota bacterium]
MAREAKEHCGLFGVFGCDDAVEKVYYGLYALQHRGEESAGIASTNGVELMCYRGMGLVGDIFSRTVLENLKAPAAIGHLRYSTVGSSNISNCQPIPFTYSRGKVAIAHNGQLVNAHRLRAEYEAHGAIFQTTTDTEIIVHLMARPSHAAHRAGMLSALSQLEGAYSLLLLSLQEMIGVRDPNGFRPLCLGEVDCGYVLASETCALDQIGARYIRDVAPGEAVFISKEGIRSETFCAKERVRPTQCIFELIYFSRPDSRVYGESVHRFRMALGRRLAQEHPVPSDIVVAVPEGGNSAALGYSHASGIPLDRGFIRNHYIGRTFIQPSQSRRARMAELKLNPVRAVVEGKRVVVVDDSIVRGTTARSRVRLLREAGAKEIHLRITCPPHRFPCYYGIDFQLKQELIAASYTLAEIREFLKVDTLGYLSGEGMLSCVATRPEHFCAACFTGSYPVPVEDLEREAEVKYAAERSRAAQP